MNHLSLFSGAGGGDLASQHLLNHKCVGYVEYENYCQKVIKQRIADGFLDAAPIFGDIRKFISEGYAEAYQGMVDIVTAGFPCQPFSVAGKQKGAGDERNMWPSTLETIRLVGPKHCLLENVPNILTHPYVRRIFGDLAEIGYCVPWDSISSALCNAEHERLRLWLAPMAHAECNGLEKCLCQVQSSAQFTKLPIALAPYCAGEIYEDGRFWPSENGICGLVDETTNWVDRLKAVGNMQDPAVAALAWKVLTSL